MESSRVTTGGAARLPFSLDGMQVGFVARLEDRMVKDVLVFLDVNLAKSVLVQLYIV